MELFEEFLTQNSFTKVEFNTLANFPEKIFRVRHFSKIKEGLTGYSAEITHLADYANSQWFINESITMRVSTITSPAPNNKYLKKM